MKDVDVTLKDLTRKLDTHWQTWLTVELDTPTTGEDPASEDPAREAARPFPLSLSLGRLDAAGLAAGFTQVNRDALAWERFQHAHAVEVRWENRLVRRSTQRIATHLVVENLTAAANLAGSPWPERIGTARRRRDQLTAEFGPISGPLLRAVCSLSDVEFEMLCTTALWLRQNDPTGLTARQVPVEGVHGKWLNAHRRELQLLSGRESLGLVERPSSVRYRYLDPEHRLSGRRVHDSHTLGDTSHPLYPPSVAIITENKDTALLFGDVAGGISVHGNGYAAVAQLRTIGWLREIPLLAYWGDIDAEGYEILDGLRAAGLAVTSVLMDVDAYERYERYGSPTDANGRPLRPRDPKPLVHLTEAERQVYTRLVDPAWSRVRRIEQERIPLTHAAAAVHQLVVAAELRDA